MVVTIGNLFDKVKKQEIKLIAGEKGLNNVVKWVHMVENVEISSFLSGGEVTFLTGIGLEKDQDLFELIQGIISYGASGIVVNIGPYIKGISNECIDYCNKKEIPLFAVPWHVHMAEIMRLFCFSLTEADKNNLEISTSIRNAIFFPERTDLYLAQLELHGIKNDLKYCAVVMCINKFDISEDEKYIEKLQQCIETYFLVSKYKGWCFNINNELVFLFNNINENKVNEVIEKIEKYCEDKGFEKQISIGIGNQTKSIRCISKSYKQAKDVVILNEKECIQNISEYRDIGIYKILFAIEDKNTIREYIDQTIGRIIEYDKYNDTDLTTVLRCYLNYNGSVQDTANELYIHRNTVNYKIRKIEEILEINLSALKDREMVDIAYKLQDII